MSIFSFFLGNRKHQEREKQELEHQEIVLNAMVKAMAAVAFADGDVDDAEVKKMSQIYFKVTGSKVDQETIHAGINVALESKEPIESALSTAATNLEPTDKANIIHAGVLIALANDSYDKSEESILRRGAESLGLDKKAFKRIEKRAKDQVAGL